MVEKKAGEKLTPWENYLKKKQDKRKQKRQKGARDRDALTTPGDESVNEDDDLLQDDDVPSDVDLNDAYFRDAYKEAGIEPAAGRTWASKDTHRPPSELYLVNLSHVYLEFFR